MKEIEAPIKMKKATDDMPSGTMTCDRLVIEEGAFVYGARISSKSKNCVLYANDLNYPLD